MTRAKRPNYIPFIILFVLNKVFFHQQQHKHRLKTKTTIFII